MHLANGRAMADENQHQKAGEVEQVKDLDHHVQKDLIAPQLTAGALL